MARPTNPRRKAEAQSEPETEVQESVEVPDETPIATAFVAEEAASEVAPVVEEIPSPETPTDDVPVEVEEPEVEEPEVEEPEEEKPVKEKKDKPNPVPGARRSAVAPQKKIKVLRTGLMLNGRILRKGDEVTAPEALFSQDDETQVASYGDVYFEVTE